MHRAVDHLKLASGRLIRGRIGIAHDTPLSGAIDEAIRGLGALIKDFSGGKSVSNAPQSLQAIVDGLEPFKSKNEDVSAVLLELIDAQSALNDTIFAVTPDGEITKKPRR